MKKETKNTMLTFALTDVDAGWLSFKLSINGAHFADRFSHVYDPLNDLKQWLENIASGHADTAFQYNNENESCTFSIKQISPNHCLLQVSEEEGNCLIEARVNREQIVRAFYEAILSFAASAQYKATEWEGETMLERLCRLLAMDAKSVTAKLKELTGKDLGELLFEADPTFEASYPEAENKGQAIRLFVEGILQTNHDAGQQSSSNETPVEYHIPVDYDHWPLNQKTSFLTECLNETLPGYSGMKLSQFRSVLIDQYLSAP